MKKSNTNGSIYGSKNKKRIALIISTAIIAALVLLCAIYVNDYYRADTDAIEAFGSPENVTVYELKSGVTVYEPTEGGKAGFIFYPGGKVECEAYSPLMKELAGKGITSVLIEMPCNLAFLGMNKANGIAESFPEIESWYIGGHSLGGCMAAEYFIKNNEVSGLVLLGSYSTSDLSPSGRPVLSIIGSEDKVVGEDYDKYKHNLPDHATEIIINGGCHAYFGMYGEQKGDGTSSITPTEQIKITANTIYAFIMQ